MKSLRPRIIRIRLQTSTYWYENQGAFSQYAGLAELADALGLEPSAERRVGSSPSSRISTH